MIHIKVIKITNIKRLLAAAAIIFAALILIKNMSFTTYVQAFSMQKERADDHNIYKIIMNKAMPVLDAYGGSKSDSESTQFIAYTLFKYVIKVDISNPKTYLKSQMPLLGLFDVPKEFTANVSAQPGKTEVKTEKEKESQNTQPDVKQNTDTQPVNNPNLDYNKPAVVIFHTHTSEAYTSSEKFTYADDGGYHRTPDKSMDVCRVGEEMKSYIEKYYGIAVVHDTTVHDLPSYNTSYKKAKVTVEGLVKKYPDAKIFIDLHRDASVPKDKLTVKINNEQAAKVMFVVGKNNPHWQENYQLSLKLNQKIEVLYPGLTRVIDVKQSVFNQDISNRMVLLEVGGDTNTLEEAIASSKLVGKAIGDFFK